MSWCVPLSQKCVGTDRANCMPAQIKVKACGVCGTDLHIHEGEFIAKFPVIPGQTYPSLCNFS